MSAALRSNSETTRERRETTSPWGRTARPEPLVSRFRWSRAAPSAAALVLIACAAHLPVPEYAPSEIEDFVEVPFPPPPARVEFVPAQPRADAVWVDGEWQWIGPRWAWSYGYWAIPPPKPIGFARWILVRRADGALLFAPGAWRRPDGTIVPTPPPLAVGRARDESVIGPDGETELTAPNIAPNE